MRVEVPRKGPEISDAILGRQDDWFFRLFSEEGHEWDLVARLDSTDSQQLTEAVTGLPSPIDGVGYSVSCGGVCLP